MFTIFKIIYHSGRLMVIAGTLENEIHLIIDLLYSLAGNPDQTIVDVQDL